MLLHFSMLVLVFFTNVLDFFIIWACFDIQAANIIGIFCISTTYAFENLSIPVVLVEAAAYRAGLAGIIWLYFDKVISTPIKTCSRLLVCM